MKDIADRMPPLLLGGLAFLLITGGGILDPGNVDWLMRGGDVAQHWLGWQFFRQAPLWQWPLGANPDYGLALASSIVYSDSIPLLALLFKPFAPFLPASFQYFGLWLLCCFVLQSYFAWHLLGLITTNRSLRLLGCAFFLLAPAWLWRLRGHHALFAHWTVLAALVLYFSAHFSALRWGALLALTALIHAYLLAMLLVLFLADLAQRIGLRQLMPGTALRVALAAGSGVGLAMWAAGYFMLDAGPGPGGFGLYRMNLLAPIDSGGVWSLLLPRLGGDDGDHEGFNFLGTGILALALLALASRRRGMPTVAGAALLRPRLLPLLVASLLLLLFAVSDRVGVGAFEWHPYRVPGVLQPLADAFRSSGRFFWPLYYLILLAILRGLLLTFPPRAALAVGLAALLVQALDSRPGLERLYSRLHPAAASTVPLRSPMWRDLGAHYRRLIVVLPRNAPPSWQVLARFAADHGMAINSGYFARTDPRRTAQARAALAAAIVDNRLDREALYVFQDDRLWRLASVQARPGDVVATLDDFRILAPGYRDCVVCAVDAQALAAVATTVDFHYAGTRTSFASGGSGLKHLLYGWSHPEPIGTWSDGDSALLRFQFAQAPAGDLLLQLDARAFLTEAHPELAVELAANGHALATLHYDVGSNTGQRVLRIPRRMFANAAGRLDLLFAFRDPASPAALRLSGDERRLGLLLVALELRPE